MRKKRDQSRRVKGLWRHEGEGCWHYDFRLAGHRFRGSTRRTALREAEKHVQRLRAETAAAIGQSAGLQPMSFFTASSRWFVEKGSRRARPEEIERDLAWLQTAIGNATPIRAIDGDMLARIVSLRQADGVAAASVNRTVIEHLRAILLRARDVWGQPVARIVWKDILLREKDPRPRPASPEEEARLLAEVRPDYRPILRFAILSGLRLEELVTLRRSQIAFGRRPSLRLIGKGDKLRVIPLTDAMATLLRHELERHDQVGGWTYAPQRWRQGRGAARAPVTISGLKTEFRRARQRAGFTSTRQDPVMGLRLHDMRATAITRVGHAGGVAAAQALAGHSEIATTMRYFKQGEEALRDAMRRAEAQPATESDAHEPSARGRT